MANQRDITAVIAQIAAEVPTGDEHDSLRASLRNVKESAMFSAPEQMALHWRDLADRLWHHLGPADTEWKRRILAIMKSKADGQD